MAAPRSVSNVLRCKSGGQRSTAGSDCRTVRRKVDFKSTDVEPTSGFDHPEFMHRKERLALLDRQGGQAAIMIPSIAVLVEGDFSDWPDALCANYRAFNRWVEEE